MDNLRWHELTFSPTTFYALWRSLQTVSGLCCFALRVPACKALSKNLGIIFWFSAKQSALQMQTKDTFLISSQLSTLSLVRPHWLRHHSAVCECTLRPRKSPLLHLVILVFFIQEQKIRHLQHVSVCSPSFTVLRLASHIRTGRLSSLTTSSRIWCSHMPVPASTLCRLWVVCACTLFGIKSIWRQSPHL